MAHKFKKEILRKLFHLMELPLLIGYSVVRYVWSERVAISVLTAVLLLVLEFEYVRLEMRPKIPKFFHFRRREHNHVTGVVYFVLATIISFAVFDYGIAMLALLLTVFGDLASALIGIKYGKNKLFHNKTLEGSLGGLCMSLFVGYLFLPTLPLVFIPMALVATFVELVTNKLDDNLTVPLFAGFTGQMIVYILGIQMVSFPYPFGWFFTLFA